MSKNTLNIALIKQAIDIAEGNRRQSTAHTKTRGQVSGGGKKPWRQKGTGRARSGSSRSPIWIGGGITFGPSSDRTFKRALPKKMAASALAQLFHYLNEQKAVTVIEKLELKEVKTKKATELLKTHAVEGKRVLIVTAAISPELVLACRNIPDVTVTENRNLSILDLARAEAVLIDAESAQTRGLIKAVKPVEKPKAVKKTS